MSLNWIASALCTAGLLVGCGGGSDDGSGVDPDVAVLDLTADEAGDICDYIINLQEQPERTVDCGGGVTVTVGINAADVAGDIADCTADLQAVPDACAADVGELEGCFEALNGQTDAELCSDNPLPAICANVIACLQ